MISTGATVDAPSYQTAMPAATLATRAASCSVMPQGEGEPQRGQHRIAGTGDVKHLTGHRRDVVNMAICGK